MSLICMFVVHVSFSVNCNASSLGQVSSLDVSRFWVGSVFSMPPCLHKPCSGYVSRFQINVGYLYAEVFQ